MMNKRKPSRQKTPMELQDPESAPPVARLGSEIKAKIGHQLRIMYGEIVNEGVPDRFAEILRGLDDPENKGSEK
jgi:hypothetical protein